MECQLKNIVLHYEVFGTGYPILLLPGWGQDTRAMVHLMEPIFAHRTGWKRIYLDPPGHGRTPGEDWIVNQDGILEVVIEFIDAVIPEQKFVIGGVSLGAYLARGVVYHRPHMIDGVLMIVPVVLAQDSKRTVPAHTFLVEDPSVMAELEPAEAEMFEFLVVRSRKALDKLRSYRRAVGKELGDTAFRETIRQDPAKYAFSYEVDDLSEPFPGPALIIAGRQDAAVGYQDAWGLLECYPRATYVVLDRAGHWLEEKDELVDALVKEWLDRVKESIESA